MKQREKVLLASLALVALAWYYWGSGTPLGLGATNLPKAEGASWGDPPLVRMDLLASHNVDFDSGGRNLFQYYVPPPPPRAERIEKPLPPPVVDMLPPPPPLPPVARAPVRPAPPTPSFRYLGFLGPKESKIAAFDDGSRMTLARVGEVVATHYKVLEFKYESVVLGYTDAQFDGQTTELKMNTAKAK